MESNHLIPTLVHVYSVAGVKMDMLYYSNAVNPKKKCTDWLS